MKSELSVSGIAARYDMSLAAVSKHLKLLESAKLVIKRRKGKQLLVRAAPAGLQEANMYIKQYETLFNERFDALEELISEEQS